MRVVATGSHEPIAWLHARVATWRHARAETLDQQGPSDQPPSFAGTVTKLDACQGVSSRRRVLDGQAEIAR